jgi:hypothetical protein
MARRFVLRVGTSGSSAVDAEAGAYDATGTAAGLRAGRRVGADAGSYAVTGTSANLAYSGEPEGPEILFESTWSHATGTSTEAITDDAMWQLNATGVGCTVSTVDLRVVAPGDAPGSWPHGGNILTARNSTAGCGGVEAFEVFPAQAPGVLWGLRFYYCQDDEQVYTHNHGLADLNAAGSGLTTMLEPNHVSGGSFNPQLRIGRSVLPPDGDILNHDGGVLFLWQAQTTAGGSTALVLPANTWHRWEYILEWTATGSDRTDNRLRAYVRIHNMAGDLLADTSHFRHVDQGYHLDTFYGVGNTFQCNPGNSEISEDRSPYLGVSQSKASSVGRMYWAAPVFYLPSSTTDFIGGV